MSPSKSIPFLGFLCITGCLSLPLQAFAGDCVSSYQYKIYQIEQEAGAPVSGAAGPGMAAGAALGCGIGSFGGPVGFVVGGAVGATVGGTAAYLEERHLNKNFKPKPINQKELQDYMIPLEAIQEAETSDRTSGDSPKNPITHQIEQELAAQDASLNTVTDQDVWDAVLSLNVQSQFCGSDNLDAQDAFVKQVKLKLQSAK